MSSAYQWRELGFSYDSVPVLHRLSGEVAAGSLVAVIGPNGAGKSTLLRILAGLIRKYSGRVEYGGRPMEGWTAGELAKRVAFVPQETRVAFPFTVGEIVMMGRLAHRQERFFDGSIDADRSREAMAWTETTALASKTFNALSGGERQRVVLASALAQNPEVLLLDEPTTFLDLHHQLAFYGILERLNQERGLTVVAVTHDVNLAARFAKRMIALREGHLVADGPPEAVLTHGHLHELFGITADIVERPDGHGIHVIPVA